MNPMPHDSWDEFLARIRMEKQLASTPADQADAELAAAIGRVLDDDEIERIVGRTLQLDSQKPGGENGRWTDELVDRSSRLDLLEVAHGLDWSETGTEEAPSEGSNSPLPKAEEKQGDDTQDGDPPA